MNAASLLVVDDGQTLSEFVRLAFVPLGYAVYTTTSGSAVVIARRVDPSIIVLHMESGSSDTLFASFSLRHDAVTCNVPIICVADNLARAIRLGVLADVWLAKPAAFEQLGVVVARCLSRYRQQSSRPTAMLQG
jgi:DNA-binding response OmpR family regulator